MAKQPQTQKINKVIESVKKEQDFNLQQEAVETPINPPSDITQEEPVITSYEPEVISSEEPVTSIYDGTGFVPDVLTIDNTPGPVDASARDDLFSILGSIRETTKKFHEGAKSRADAIHGKIKAVPVEEELGKLEAVVAGGKILNIDEIKELDNNLTILNLPKTNIQSVEDIKGLLGRLTSRSDGTYNMDDLDALIEEQFADQLKAAQGKTTNLRILAYDESLGLDDVVQRVRNKKPDEILPVGEFVALGLKADLLNSRIRTILEGEGFDKLLSTEDIVEVQKLMHLLGELKIAGRQTSSAYGRGLQANRNNVFKNESVLDEATTIQQAIGKSIFDESMTPEEFQIVRLQMTDLSLNPAQLKEAANNVITNMGGWRRWSEAWTQLYINGKLAAPSTAMINLASGLGFRMLHTAESLVAGTYNKLFFRNDALGVRLNAVLNQTKGSIGGTLDGLSMGYKALFETPDLTKLDMRKPNFMTVENLAPSMANHPYAKGVDYLLAATNIPSKTLIVGDQIVKGLTYRQQIEYLSTKKMNIAIQKGMPIEEAGAMYHNLKKYPTQDMIEEANKEMLTATFQRTLDNKFYNNVIRTMMNHPLGKIHQPFTNTLTNIFVEGIGKRTLLGAIPLPMNKNIIADITGKNGLEAMQLAHSRMILGNGFFGAAFFSATYDYDMFGAGWTKKIGAGTHNKKDVVLIGSYPGDPGMQQFWKANKIMPNSIGFLQNDGTYKYVPYEGVGEPLSVILTLAADASYALTRPGTTEQDSQDIEKIITSVMNSFVEYTKEEAFLKNLTVLGHVLNTDPSEGENVLVGFLTDKALNIGGNYIDWIANPITNFGGYYPSSFANFVGKRRQDYYEDNTMTADQENWYKEVMGSNVPQWVADSYQIINGIINRSGWSNIVDLNTNRALNVWGEEMPLPETGITFYGQITTSKNLDEFYIVDQWFNDNGFYLSLPSKKWQGVKALNNDQYRDLIKFMNEDNAMLSEMNRLFTDNSPYATTFQNAPFGIQKDYIMRIRRKRLKYAQEMLAEKYPELNAISNIAGAEYIRTGEKSL